MEITEVRVKLVDGKEQDKLKAFCSITIDDSFVIRDLKIIEGSKGLFVAMPSRKLTVRCDSCSAKNQVNSRYCSYCGDGIHSDAQRDGRTKLHADIAHPINSECRDRIQRQVLEAFDEEFAASGVPGYQPIDLDEESAACAPTCSEADLDSRDSSNSEVDVEEYLEDSREAPSDDRDEVPEAIEKRGRISFSRSLASRERNLPNTHENTRPNKNRHKSKPNSSERKSRDRKVESLPPDDNFGAGLF